MAKVTIQSIAKDLGLSRNTVSMALKGNELVARRTRDMVLRYAEQTGYMAGALPEDGEKQVSQKEEIAEHHIMILRKPDVAVYWDKVVNGISEEASRSHCQTQVAVVTQQDEEELRLPLGLNEDVEAVFCVKMMNREYVKKIRKKGIPVFLLDTYKDPGEEMPGDIVKIESFQPVVKLVRHLLAQGLRQIGFLNEGSSQFETMHDRLDGYLYAMRQGGIEPPAQLVMPNTELESSEFYNPETFDKIVKRYTQEILPEAVVCGNDEIAKYLTQALRKAGIRVPEDIAVTGFDNDEEGMLDPFFTTVNVDAKWLGRRMVQCFLWRKEHPDAPYEKIEISGRIIVRKSSRKNRSPQ